jgi:hypothetical protein
MERRVQSLAGMNSVVNSSGLHWQGNVAADCRMGATGEVRPHPSYNCFASSSKKGISVAVEDNIFKKGNHAYGSYYRCVARHRT